MYAIKLIGQNKKDVLCKDIQNGVDLVYFTV